MDLRGPDIDTAVWDDIERFLRNPGDILEELDQEIEMDSSTAIAEAERVTLESAMVALAQRRKKTIELNTRDRISDTELVALLAEIAREQKAVEERLVKPAEDNSHKPLDLDLLQQLRHRLHQGLHEPQRQEIVRLLVKGITVHTDEDAEGKKKEKR